MLRIAPPVAVPGIFVGFEKPSSSADRCHSLRSLLLPPAALPSLPMVGMTVSVAVAVEAALKG